MLGTATGNMFAPTYTSIFINKLESDFLKSQELIQLFWHRYINNIFFSWTHDEEKPFKLLFLHVLKNCYPKNKLNKLPYKKHIPFLDLTVKL